MKGFVFSFRIRLRTSSRQSLRRQDKYFFRKFQILSTPPTHAGRFIFRLRAAQKPYRRKRCAAHCARRDLFARRVKRPDRGVKRHADTCGPLPGVPAAAEPLSTILPALRRLCRHWRPMQSFQPAASGERSEPKGEDAALRPGMAACCRVLRALEQLINILS